MLGKRLAESLTVRVFLITVLILFGAGAVTFGLIAWATPSTYTAVVNDDLTRQVKVLAAKLEQSSYRDCGPLLDDFIRASGAQAMLVGPDGALADTGAQLAVQPLYEDSTMVITASGNLGEADAAIARAEGGYRLTLAKGGEVACKYLIAAPGRSGAEWFSNQCKDLGLELLNNQVDIGVRVELPATVFEHITDVVYESKLVYRTKQYGDQVRTFCMNPYGHVVAENVEGINTVNGHSYADPALRSENTNFALLVSNRFTKPFNEPYRYGKHVASLSNMLAGGVLVQRFGDLVGGRRTNEHRMSKSFVRPTLTAAVPGDLSLTLPKRQLDNIIEMIYQLDKIAPGTANYDTLLYGAEVKFYSARLQLTEELETALPNFFAAGDGAGVTRGLAQAGASGVQAARAVVKRM